MYEVYMTSHAYMLFYSYVHMYVWMYLSSGYVKNYFSIDMIIRNSMHGYVLVCSLEYIDLVGLHYLRRSW